MEIQSRGNGGGKNVGEDKGRDNKIGQDKGSPPKKILSPQIIGCAYTYHTSLAVRKNATKGLPEEKFYSAQKKDFSYFLKSKKMAIGVGESINLFPGNPKVSCWPEPELALLLGEKHKIIAVALAIDLTAPEVEYGGRCKDKEGNWHDGTFFGKVWDGSLAIGEFKPVVDIGELEKINFSIGLKVERAGNIIFDHKYSTALGERGRKELFSALPDKVLKDYGSLVTQHGEDLPPSKKIQVEMMEGKMFLPENTIILAGTGLMKPPTFLLQAEDTVTVCSNLLQELKVKVKELSIILLGRNEK
ncbi:hypothetical protein HYU14_02520 [Candidatus Woesearchaeota archaeon]|nr:hypothetical protein [Candidatus Woesearchaeota archaeon]